MKQDGMDWVLEIQLAQPSHGSQNLVEVAQEIGDLWDHMWHRKYTLDVEETQLIRWNEHNNGLLIWNVSW
jgi:hypothetical protein